MQNRGWSPVGWGVLPRARAGSAPAVPDAANLRGYMEGDNLDGSNNGTLVNGLPVSSVVNLGTLGGTFDQLTALNMPTFSTTAGPGGTKPALTFDGTDWLTSSLLASAWTFLHDGTGSTVYSVARTAASANLTIAATGTSGARGIMHRYAPTFTAAYIMHDGTALRINFLGTASGITSGSFDMLTSTLASADTPDLSLYVNGVLNGAGANATAFSALDATASLTIGANALGGQPYNGPIRRIMAYQGAHTPAQIAAVLAWSQALDAVTYPAP